VVKGLVSGLPRLGFLSVLLISLLPPLKFLFFLSFLSSSSNSRNSGKLGRHSPTPCRHPLVTTPKKRETRDTKTLFTAVAQQRTVIKKQKREEEGFYLTPIYPEARREL
jgi:hypothetical protein